jgi:hypothetical protein
MGTFHSNLQVSGSTREAAREAVRLAGLRPAFVVGQPPWIGVCAELLDGQDVELMEAACRNLSLRLEARVFGFLVHDSDVLLFFLYAEGRRVDVYSSRPGYFSGERQPPSGGDVAALLKMALPGTTEAQLRRLLHELRLAGPRKKRWAPQVEALPFWRRLIVKRALWLLTLGAGPPAELLLAELAALLGIPEVQALSSFRDLREDARHAGDAI